MEGYIEKQLKAETVALSLHVVEEEKNPLVSSSRFSKFNCVFVKKEQNGNGSEDAALGTHCCWNLNGSENNLSQLKS